MDKLHNSKSHDRNEDAIVPWDKLSQWVHSIAVVTFDLELGQALEFSYPRHVSLSDAERSNICYLAFPDSNSGCMGDTQYCFRIRKTASSKRHINATDRLYIKDCPVTLLRDDSHYYGYVYFRQVRDRSLKRGYFQKSVVLLSPLPYFNFFKDLVEIIAPEYFDNGEDCLEAACADIDRWPYPLPGKTLKLPLMGMFLHVRIPTKQDKPGTTLLNGCEKNTVLSPYTFSSINEVNLYESLKDVISHMHLLWELVLLGEPLVVMAPSPTICASFVLAVISSINPLRYCCDFRPYFTIHDSEFKEYTSKSKELTAIQYEDYWRSVTLYVSNSETCLSSSQACSTILPFIKGLIGKGSGKEETALIRRHFLELTQSFIIPLERYMASLMPLQKTISPHKPPPSLKPFNPEEFIETVRNNGPQLTSVTKGDWIGLYQQFLFSANFDYWLRKRRREMKGKVLSLHLIALSETNVSTWGQEKSEVEVVDMILLLRKKIRLVNERKLDVPAATLEKLSKQVEKIIETLPPDLQSILKKEGLPVDEVT